MNRSIPVIFGITFLLSIISTCERLPELILEITTDSIIFLPAREYKLSGSIVSFGSEPVTQHGFCWAEASNPTTKGQVKELGGKNSKGSFSSMISNLSSSTYYYVRAYVITSVGTEYGEEKTFTTPAPTLAAITTSEVSNITQDSAQSGGTIIDDGGTEINAKGVCWDTTANPTIANSHSTNGTGTSPFTSKLTGLDCSTTYYVRAYATNMVGTTYGNEISFKTIGCIPGTPNIITAKISSITQSSAKCGGNVTDEGFSSVIARGVCWSESPHPTPAGNHTADGSGLGSYTSSITGLTPTTTYYVRAYATNNEGSSYGDEESFTTHSASGETVTDYDGNVYSTIQIGDQLWMRENLKATHYKDGTSIPLVESKSEWDALGTTAKAYCWYDNNTSNRDIFGGLYTWATAMNGTNSSSSNPSKVQGICPSGWHLPSDEEWKQLEVFLGMDLSVVNNTGRRGTDEGGKLKESDFTHWISPNTGATNSSGFTAIPGGSRSSYGDFSGQGSRATFWSSTQSDINYVWYRILDNENSDVRRITNLKVMGFSVRCIKGEAFSLPTITTVSASDITQSTASTGGDIIDDGGSLVTARGVCWSTSEDPTLSDEFTTDGSGTGSFISSITGLDCNTTYYVRAYSTNSVGTAYGSLVNFTTSQCSVVSLPAVTTTYLSNITRASADGGGEVIDDGGGTITARGVCWSTTQSPTISDSHTIENPGTGIFTSNLSGLTKSTTYSVRAYATNSAGTSYGDELILRTYEGTITDYDENVYWTVIVGDQNWMAENLNVTHYADGSAITLVESKPVWDALGITAKAYCWYDDNMSNGDDYGALYTWAGAMNGASSSDANPNEVQGVCPDGWHLPRDAEWKQLEMHLGMSQPVVDSEGWRGSNEGNILKEAGTKHWYSPNTGATNEVGFTALPSGNRYGDGVFDYLNGGSYFWSSTELNEGASWSRVLGWDFASIHRYAGWNKDGYSVRCLKGQGYSIPTVTTNSVNNINENSVEAGGNVSDNGGLTATEKGVCWSTNQMPTIDDLRTIDGSGLGSFSSLITGLSPNTTYFIRAYATNGVGTGYGNVLTIKTEGDTSTTVTDYDGNIYNTIQIGDQIWMQENLKVTHYSDGTSILLVEIPSEWDALSNVSKAYCWYENLSSNGNTYGALYSWAAAMNGAISSDLNPSGVQGVCPSDWHLPSNEEWTELTVYLGGSEIAGDKLKELGTTHWDGPNTGNNVSGFTALPGGYRSAAGGEFDLMGNNGSWWSATEVDATNIWTVFLYHHSSRVDQGWAIGKYGFSVRCIKN